MNEIAASMVRWQMDVGKVRERMYRAPTPRERERWHALWLLAQGWTVAKVAEMLERDAHTIAGWLGEFAEKGPEALAFVQSGGAPPPSTRRKRPR